MHVVHNTLTACTVRKSRVIDRTQISNPAIKPMPFYGLSRRVHGVNYTLTACTVLSIYVRMSQRTCTILCKHSRLPQGLYFHHVCRCWKPNFAANDTRFIFLLRCYPSGEHGDKQCPCLKFVLFRV